MYTVEIEHHRKEYVSMHVCVCACVHVHTCTVLHVVHEASHTYMYMCVCTRSTHVCTADLGIKSIFSYAV
jgi:hypothetical protein